MALLPPRTMRRTMRTALRALAESEGARLLCCAKPTCPKRRNPCAGLGGFCSSVTARPGPCWHVSGRDALPLGQQGDGESTRARGIYPGNSATRQRSCLLGRRGAPCCRLSGSTGSGASLLRRAWVLVRVRAWYRTAPWHRQALRSSKNQSSTQFSPYVSNVRRCAKNPGSLSRRQGSKHPRTTSRWALPVEKPLCSFGLKFQASFGHDPLVSCQGTAVIGLGITAFAAAGLLSRPVRHVRLRGARR